MICFAFREQEDIGWENLMFWRMSAKWLEVGFVESYTKMAAYWAADTLYQFL